MYYLLLLSLFMFIYCDEWCFVVWYVIHVVLKWFSLRYGIFGSLDLVTGFIDMPIDCLDKFAISEEEKKKRLDTSTD